MKRIDTFFYLDVVSTVLIIHKKTLTISNYIDKYLIVIKEIDSIATR